MALTSNSNNSFSSLFASLKFGIKKSTKTELASDLVTITSQINSPSSKLRRQALSLDFSSEEHSKILEELVQIEIDTKKRNSFVKRKSLSRKQSTAYNSNESLHNAVLNGNVELTRQILLTEESVEINTLLPPGWSALNHACRLGNLKIIKLLLEFGADPSIPNNDGLTPLLIAVTNGYFDVAAYLINDGGVSCKEVRNGFQAYNTFTDFSKNKLLVRKSKSFESE